MGLGYYLVDRVLPGLITMSIWAGIIWLLHRAENRRRDNKDQDLLDALREIKDLLDTR